MSEPALLVERDGHVVTLTMNRPEVKNAINPEMLCRLADAWDLIDGDDEIRVAILTGAGGAFCAGADLDKLVGRIDQRTAAGKRVRGALPAGLHRHLQGPATQLPAHQAAHRRDRGALHRRRHGDPSVD